MDNVLQFPTDELDVHHPKVLVGWRAWAKLQVANWKQRKAVEPAPVADMTEWKPDVSANPREVINTPLLNQIRQARSLLENEAKKI